MDSFRKFQLILTMLGALSLGAASPRQAVPERPPSEARFAKIEALARLIVETDRAAWVASDVLMAHPGDPSKVGSAFFTVLDHDTWYVYFGKFSADGSQYLPGYVLSAPRAKVSAMKLVPPESAPRDVLGYARAVERSRRDAVAALGNPRVNPVLVPEADGISVYVMQGSSEGVLFGGDFHDLYDRTGTQLIKREQYHKGLVPAVMKMPDDAKGKLAYQVHNHILIEEPSPTEVALVMEFPQIGELVVTTEKHAYRVDNQGHIHDFKLPKMSPPQRQK